MPLGWELVFLGCREFLPVRTAASDICFLFSASFLASSTILLHTLLRTSIPIPPSQSPTTSYEHIKLSVKQWAEQRHCVSPSLHQPTRQPPTQKVHIRCPALCHALRFFPAPFFFRTLFQFLALSALQALIDFCFLILHGFFPLCICSLRVTHCAAKPPPVDLPVLLQHI